MLIKSNFKKQHLKRELLVLNISVKNEVAISEEDEEKDLITNLGLLSQSSHSEAALSLETIASNLDQ